MKKIFTSLVFLVFAFIFFSFTWSDIQSIKAVAQNSSSSGAVSSSSSSSGGSQVVLSDKFSGIWSAKVEKTILVNGIVVKQGTRPVNFRLCSKDGTIRGILFNPGFFTKALITNQNVISANEVEVTLTDRHRRTSTLRLTLVGDIQLKGAFSNGVNFDAVKKSEFKLCEVFRKCDINDLFNLKVSNEE